MLPRTAPPTATPSLDAYQQAFSLSMLSNRMSSHSGTASGLQQQLMYELSAYLSGVPQGQVPDKDWVYPSPMSEAVALMGDWSLVWGPAVWQDTTASGAASNAADNAMFVAHCDRVAFPGGPALPAYVVAIAATNPVSSFDWLTEDFDVSAVVKFDTFVPGNPVPASGISLGTAYISMGTAIGVGNLLTQMPSPAGAPAAGQSLQQFLEDIPKSEGAAIIFAGHSLAGALSPTLAYTLSRQGQLRQFAKALVYPTAGATPGNDSFGLEFAVAFPPLPKGWTAQAGDYQKWNTLLWNQFDVIPHAWALTVLAKIPTLYGPPPLTDVLALVGAAEVNSIASKILYTRLPNNCSLPGVLQSSAVIDGTVTPISVPPTGIEDFVRQIAVQHVSMYLGIAPSMPGAPPVPGLILNQPLPQPANLSTLFGVAKVPDAAALASLVTWIENWVAQHTLPSGS
jgi:hypothetical protein